ncbi:hypothetical protein T492DRAFT_1009650 [Pavlovales sp. CCMP2436]|nr:hypothetical protein T492DRAFT_1009650 [Pavlovales sp. CCMP2436]|mmetsp:Transcript_156/g.402  ORF Transcript_156/g.402 Transcript_156/m.402 type:complete len:190 (+) Transcript_156:116-685(+)
MVRISLLLLAALAVDSVHIGSRTSRSLLAPRRALRARIVAGQIAEPSSDRPERKPPPGGALGMDDRKETEVFASDFTAGSPDEFEEMTAKVARIQSEIDSNRVGKKGEEQRIEDEGGFFGEPVGDFIAGAFKSLPEFEIPPPKVMVQKVALSMALGLLFYFVVTLTDGFILELLRPIVKYQVDNLAPLS